MAFGFLGEILLGAIHFLKELGGLPLATPERNGWHPMGKSLWILNIMAVSKEVDGISIGSP